MLNVWWGVSGHVVNTINRLKLTTVVKANSKTALYTPMSNKGLQNIGGELHATPIPAARRDNS